jgi:hypothetical protein
MIIQWTDLGNFIGRTCQFFVDRSAFTLQCMLYRGGLRCTLTATGASEVLDGARMPPSNRQPARLGSV